MAQTSTWLATDSALEMLTGGYWDALNIPGKTNAKAYNQKTWNKFWEVSAAQTKIAD